MLSPPNGYPTIGVGAHYMQNNDYVHGYSERENSRLCDQATTLAQLLHHDTVYPGSSMVLEAGCGVGAQTVILAENSPGSRIISVDISTSSIKKAGKMVKAGRFENVSFVASDIFGLPFAEETFDHVFVCFVLEHLEKPIEALASLKRVLKKGGTITIIEGDHGSSFFYPESDEALKAIGCLVKLQKAMRGNSLIGRQLFPLLEKAGFNDIAISPRMVYADSSRPDIVEGFTKNTFIAMVEGVKGQAISSGMIDETAWDKGIRDLNRTAEPGGTFCYTFFKATGKN